MTTAIIKRKFIYHPIRYFAVRMQESDVKGQGFGFKSGYNPLLSIIVNICTMIIDH